MVDTDRRFAPPAVRAEHRPDGSLVLRSPDPLGEYGRCLSDWLVHWASVAADRPFILERATDGRWSGASYGEALRAARALASWLLQIGCSTERPIAILCENSVRNALLGLAAMYVGIPIVPISPAYSLVSRDFEKLRIIIQLANPALLYVSNPTRFHPALEAITELHDAILLADKQEGATPRVTLWDDVIKTEHDQRVERAFSAVGPDTVVKLLCTSGSTGMPKAVVTTQRMLLVNQQQLRQVWPFLSNHLPVLVEWLPWSHTFGGSCTFNLVLRSGGTLYIDAGRPLPQLFGSTIANLRDIAPTLFFNVPRGYEMLLPVLRDDREFRDHFFSRLQVMFCAAAALPQHIFEALRELAAKSAPGAVRFLSAWGSTETAPMATSCHFPTSTSGVIGLPVPGVELKLVPHGPKLEVRVRGPNVMREYWKRPDLTAQAFDEDGFYRIGDAVRPVDRNRLELGLLFDGRVAEDFKLSTGTWVNAGAIRLRAIAALAPLIQDVVVSGHDRDSVALLLFPNVTACRELCSNSPSVAPVEQLLADQAICNRIKQGLRELRKLGTGSSTFASRALLMSEPPSIDAGEITDKGYINQHAVLERRKALVEALFAASPDAQVIRVDDE